MTKNTTDRQTPSANQTRLGEVLEAYGADPARWPKDERTGLEAITDAPNDQAANAGALDTLLDAMPEIETSAALSDTILRAVSNTPSTAPARPTRTQASRTLGEWLSDLWPSAPIWRPAAAFAVLALVGFALVSITGTPVNQGPNGADNAQVAALDPALTETPAAPRDNRDVEAEWVLVFDPAGVSALAVSSYTRDADNDWNLMFDPAGGVVMAGYVVGDM